MLNNYFQKISEYLRNTKYFNNIKILLSTSIVVFLAIIIFIIYPNIQKIFLTNNDILVRKNELEKKQANDYSLQEIINNYRQHEPKIAELNKTIRTQNRELEFITTLETIAEKYNLEQKINIGAYEDIKDTDFKSMPLQLILEGDYIDNLKYLQDLESLSSYINIKNINITSEISKTPKQVNENGEQIAIEKITKMVIVAETYWQ